MFLREVTTKGKTYLVIVKSYREKGKIKQKSIASLGCIDKWQNKEALKKIALSLLKYCEDNKTHLDITTTQEKQRKIWGAPLVLRKLWDKFRLEELFAHILSGHKIKFDFFSAVFLMVLDRICQPQSKLKSYQEQHKYYGIQEPSLQHLYRALDVLAEHQEDLEKYLFEANKNLFNTKVDLVFYDVTSLYFESVTSDSLRDFGFSKDQKINEVQIILGLLVDLEGRPIGFDIFPGNTFEGKTVQRILAKLKEKFQINRLVFVGDQGLLSKANLQTITSLGYEYIVGARIKNKSRSIKEQILDEEGYLEVKTKDEEEIFKYKEILIDGKKLICSYSSKRARKDKKDRERLVQKAEEILRKGSPIISRRGARKYLKTGTLSSQQTELDKERIAQAERWDGYYGVESNCPHLSGPMVLDIYHQLWKIEEAFRVLKSHLEARPIFHWTPSRIKGHLVLCFVAFLLERTLELELKQKGVEYSPRQIREALNSLQFSEIEIEGQSFYLRSAVRGLANDVLRVLRIKIPPNIAPPEAFF